MLLSSQVELFRDMRQLREVTGLLDSPVELDLAIAQGASLERFGLKSPATDTTLVLFLTDRCATCRSLAEALDRSVPEHVQVVLNSPGGEGSALAESWRLDRAMHDADGTIMDSLGIATVPAAILVEDGKLARCQTVPSVRQLRSLINDTKPARQSPMRRV